MTLILGINAFHADAAAALVRDGRIVAAVEEERFRRIKHWAGFPSESIRWCLSQSKATIRDVDHIAINTSPGVHRGKRLAYILKTRPDLRFLVNRWKSKKERNNLSQHLLDIFSEDQLRATLHFVEHHRAHLASAFYPSPFGEASIVSVDGFGDFASSAWGFGNNNNMIMDGQVFFPHSLGAFYTAITQFLGFPNYGDEYKVMGLAPYGTPSFTSEMHQLVTLYEDGSYKLNLDYFQHAGKKDLDHQWNFGSPQVGCHWDPKLEELLGPARKKDEPIQQKHKDLALSAQLMYEDAFFNILEANYRKYECVNLAIAGGCGANSVANGKIPLRTKFKNVYVQAASGDAGGALGCALDVWHQIQDQRCEPMLNAYLGCSSDNHEIKSLLESDNIKSLLSTAEFKVQEISDMAICNRVADALCEGLVVGWFEGKMEWGPRALGHRSILGDPRRADMKDILNMKIKRRESFRPFAPSVLREEVKNWFLLDGDVPFMMQVFSIREDKRERIPAVTHVDGSGRLQTVTHSDNQRYYQLIKCFYEKTGVPMILNTSFNENEPIVCKPREALDCFLRTRMDILVMENIMIERLNQA